MYNHTTSEYICPICLGVQGIENESTLLKQADLIYKDQAVSAFINSFWIGKNEGHVIVVPNEHVEHLYDLSDELGHQISDVAKKIAIAMKTAYTCDGITLRQNNEPAGDQHALHYHLHIFPRYEGDTFNVDLSNAKRLSSPEERVIYAEKLRTSLQ